MSADARGLAFAVLRVARSQTFTGYCTWTGGVGGICTVHLDLSYADPKQARNQGDDRQVTMFSGSIYLRFS